jgi:mRNA-degrading endonuclease RelE of RelBE toxin-antitoxin system
LPQSFRFLVHTCFQEQLDRFAEDNIDAWSSLLTQIKKARSDPFRAGKAMHDILIKKLQGRIYRLHVKGPRGFRFIYLVAPQQHIVMGVFVSSEVKAKFDYSKVPWEEYATKIYEDLINNNMDNFKELKLSD